MQSVILRQVVQNLLCAELSIYFLEHPFYCLHSDSVVRWYVLVVSVCVLVWLFVSIIMHEQFEIS